MKLFVALLLGLLASAGSGYAKSFTFAGLGRQTTLEELKRRYPNSSTAGNYLYVAAADSHDHIYGIEIPGSNPAGRLRLTFERSRELSGDGHPHYPSCRRVRSIVEASYGSPAKIEEYSEERSLNRRLSWTKSGEVLSVHCFRMESGALLAEALTITTTR